MRWQPGAGVASVAVLLALGAVATIIAGGQWLAVFPGSLAIGYGGLYVARLPE